MADNSQETARNSQEQPAPKRGAGGRGRGRPFTKGKSPNPGGRPRVTEDYKVAMARLDGKAIQGLEHILDNKRHKKFAEVCIYVVNRNHGKPVETHELSGVNGGPIRTTGSIDGLDSEQRARRLAELEAKMVAAKQQQAEPTPDGQSGSV
jgi:hypothetical protein